MLEPVTPVVSYSPMEYGLVGFLLLLIWQVLNVGKQLFLAKKGASSTGPTVMSALACQTDPLYSQRIRDIHAHTLAVQKQIDRGMFQCQWHGRDEIRDFLEALKEQTAEMRALRDEIKKTRNGQGGS